MFEIKIVGNTLKELNEKLLELSQGLGVAEKVASVDTAAFEKMNVEQKGSQLNPNEDVQEESVKVFNKADAIALAKEIMEFGKDAALLVKDVLDKHDIASVSKITEKKADAIHTDLMQVKTENIPLTEVVDKAMQDDEALNEKEDSQPTVTLEDIKKLGMEISKAKKSAQMKAVLDSHEVKGLSQLDPSDYADVHAQMLEILGN